MFTPLSAEQIMARLPKRAVAVKRLDKLGVSVFCAAMRKCGNHARYPALGLPDRAWRKPPPGQRLSRCGCAVLADRRCGAGRYLVHRQREWEHPVLRPRFTTTTKVNTMKPRHGLPIWASVLFPSCKRPCFCKSLKGCSMRKQNSASQYRMLSKPGWIPLPRVCMSNIRLHIGR